MSGMCQGASKHRSKEGSPSKTADEQGSVKKTNGETNSNKRDLC